MLAVQRLDRNLHDLLSRLHHSMDLVILQIYNNRPCSRNGKPFDKIKNILLKVYLYRLPSIGGDRILGINYSEGIILDDKYASRLFPKTTPHIGKRNLVVDVTRYLINLHKSIINSLLKLADIDTLLLLFVRIKIRREFESSDSIFHCFKMFLIKSIRSKEK